MSQITALGRKAARDQQRNYLSTMLAKHEWFQRAPQQILAGLAELLLTSRELRAAIKAQGVMRPDGTCHPALDHYRKYKLAELSYIETIMQRLDEESGVDDLVAQMARASGVESAETVEPAAEAASGPDSDPQT